MKSIEDSIELFYAFFTVLTVSCFGTTREQVNHKHIKLEKGIRETLTKCPIILVAGGRIELPTLGL